VTLHFQDGDLQDIFRAFADISGLNVVVHPGTQGLVTYHGRDVPWDEVLDRLLAPNGFVARVEGNVLEIGQPRKLGEKRSFSGAAISFDYRDKELVETLREVAAHAHASVEVPEGVMGRVFFKLDEVPWDQAFDLLVRLNGLTWTRTGDVIRVEPRRRAPSR
jgi:type II secretory pathway component HofQ